MGLAVELRLDSEAERAVLGVWEAVRAVSGSRILLDLQARPHVSLAVYPEGVRGALEDAVARFRAAPLPFTLASAGTFPSEEGAVFLAPVPDEGLLRLHREWHALAPGGMPYYAPGAWVPHCTVGIGLPDAAVAPALAAARALMPIQGRYEAIGLIEYDPKGIYDPKRIAAVRRLFERPLGS